LPSGSRPKFKTVKFEREKKKQVLKEKSYLPKNIDYSDYQTTIVIPLNKKKEKRLKYQQRLKNKNLKKKKPPRSRGVKMSREDALRMGLDIESDCVCSSRRKPFSNKLLRRKVRPSRKYQVSILPTFYEQLFCMKVFCAVWQINIGAKDVCKMMVKLMTGLRCGQQQL
jgi:hypothetical protein